MCSTELIRAKFHMSKSHFCYSVTLKEVNTLFTHECDVNDDELFFLSAVQESKNVPICIYGKKPSIFLSRMKLMKD